MDQTGPLGTAHSRYTFCRINGFTLYTACAELPETGGYRLCFQGYRNADQHTPHRFALSAQPVGARGGSGAGAGHFAFGRELECAGAGFTSFQGKGGSG